MPQTKDKAGIYRLAHPDDLPREKLEKKGRDGLSNEELLSIILRTGYRGSSVFNVSKRILQAHSLEELMGMSYNELVGMKGVGRSKASLLIASFELARRALSKDVGVLPAIKRPEDVLSFSGDIVHEKKENLLGLYLNGRNQVLYRETISIGSLNASIVHPREVFNPGIRNNASSVILIHNHPSGDSEPSADDLNVTKRMVEASKIVGIDLVDHIIVSSRNFYSFKEHGRIG